MAYTKEDAITAYLKLTAELATDELLLFGAELAVATTENYLMWVQRNNIPDPYAGSLAEELPLQRHLIDSAWQAKSAALS